MKKKKNEKLEFIITNYYKPIINLVIYKFQFSFLMKFINIFYNL